MIKCYHGGERFGPDFSTDKRFTRLLIIMSMNSIKITTTKKKKNTAEGGVAPERAKVKVKGQSQKQKQNHSFSIIIPVMFIVVATVPVTC